MPSSRLTADRKAPASSIYAAMLAVVAQIPPGRVATYGQIARLAGFPRNARMVGRALAQSGTDVPWHRVVNHQGAISHRGLDGHDDLQRVLLEAEGVEFEANGVIKLKKWGWMS
ncbi:MGMT family protein [Silvimonas iriomotensis]|uniref:Methyltransferase n=1 Tax=Silvimonas iriomotensis TaxID=449662 RepID=A0ABQ2PBU5_9NEIS|nr:MGMT family protein [Silvimonas iriomotensis]GGP22886.1 methyltransferase [Silvimonas iriomotensis]